MSSDNGGIIGVVNDPTSTVASGVWQQEEQYEAKVNDTWPQRALFTTKSLRFNDGSSDYLNRTPSQEGSRRQLTFSCWFKKGLNAGTWTWIMHSGASNDGTPSFGVGIKSNALSVIDLGADGAYDINFITNRLFRDPSAWYHVVVAIDTTQGTESNRVKIYVNGVQETSFSTAVYPSQNHDFNTGPTMTNYATEIGRDNYNGGESYFDGYMAEIILVDGSQLAPTSFGVANSDGVWTPIPYTGTFGTNGFNLQFQNAAALGTDSSPNGNTFTVNNLTSIDQSTDYPEVNFATLNPLYKNTTNDIIFANGNLDGSMTDNTKAGSYTTIGMASGKFYCEVKIIEFQNAGEAVVGVSGRPASDMIDNKNVGDTTQSVGYRTNGQSEIASTTASYGNSYTTNDIIGIALDVDNSKLYFSKNGTFQNSGDPTSGSTGTGALSMPVGVSSCEAGAYFFGFGDTSTASSSAHKFSFNFGSPSFAISSGNTDGNGYGNFEYAVPSGYYALNTANLSEFG